MLTFFLVFNKIDVYSRIKGFTGVHLLMNKNYSFAALLIAIAIVLSALIVSNTWKQHLSRNQLLSVTGSAKVAFTSDRGVLSGSIAAKATTASEAFKALESQKPALLVYLSEQGFSKETVSFKPATMSSTMEYNSKGYQTGKVLDYTYRQRFSVTSPDVKKILSMSTSLPSLIEKGVFVQVDMPSFTYTKIADLKIKAQALAAKDAMSRAAKIAESTGSELGEIRKARMGVIQITPKHSTRVSDYGENDTSAIEKELRAVVSASFSVH